jgi:hypothetical protein
MHRLCFLVVDEQACDRLSQSTFQLCESQDDIGSRLLDRSCRRYFPRFFNAFMLLIGEVGVAQYETFDGLSSTRFRRSPLQLNR